MRFVKQLLLILLLLPLEPLHAQEGRTPAPIIIGSAGDFWRYDGDNGTAERFTSWGHNQAPILNEVTGLLAYNSYASIWVDTLNTGGTPSGSVASNIWVIDPVTQDAFRVAEQPANASIATRTFIARSDRPTVHFWHGASITPTVGRMMPIVSVFMLWRLSKPSL